MSLDAPQPRRTPVMASPEVREHLLNLVKSEPLLQSAIGSMQGLAGTTQFEMEVQMDDTSPTLTLRVRGTECTVTLVMAATEGGVFGMEAMGGLQ